MTTDEYPPFTSAKLVDGGFTTAIVQRVFSSMGQQSHVQWLPWNRGETMVHNGHLTATYPYAITPERQQQFYISDPIINFDNKVFAHKDLSLEFNQASDLKGLTYCLPLGYGGFEELRQMHEAGDIKVVTTDSIESCFKMLLHKRVHFIVEDGRVGRILLHKALGTNAEQITILDKTFNSRPGHLLISRNHPAAKTLRDRFNDHLKQLKQAGIIEQIINNSEQ
ncbi:MAG: transporter substrate-binding domain-containing protein [Motiliproteus sp.]